MDRLSTSLLAGILGVLTAIGIVGGIALATYHHKPAGWQPNAASCQAVNSSTDYSSQTADRLGQCIDWEASKP